MSGEYKRLYRSRDDRMIAGVCGGIANYFGVDPTIIRLVFVVFALGIGSGVLAYIILAIIVPEEPEGYGAPPPAPPEEAETEESE
jgi:phage shock protein C